MRNPFKKDKNIKASAEAVKIMETGAAIINSISSAYIALAASTDGLPKDKPYRYDPQTLSWTPVVKTDPKPAQESQPRAN